MILMNTLEVIVSNSLVIMNSNCDM